MIVKISTLLFFLLTCTVCPANARTPFTGVVKKIIDGDSLLIKAGRKTIEVRLYGIDCPEYDQPFSAAAKALVRRKVYGKKVLVQPLYTDSYRRLVAIVTYGDHTLNSDLVQSGLAWIYPQYCRKKICRAWQEREESARTMKKGIWSRSRPISPWKWKKQKRSQKRNPNSSH